MAEEQRAYQSYLLRLWRTSHNGKLGWRASLESAQNGERCGFADLESLFAFLDEQTGDGSRQDYRAQPTKR